MREKELPEADEIYSKALRAGRRTYFFDVRSTKAGDYYLTITESKKQTNSDGTFFFKKHKMYLYKEDFEGFKELLHEMTDFVVKEKGSEVISDVHQPNFYSGKQEDSHIVSNKFTDIDFDEI